MNPCGLPFNQYQISYLACFVFSPFGEAVLSTGIYKVRTMLMLLMMLMMLLLLLLRTLLMLLLPTLLLLLTRSSLHWYASIRWRLRN